MSERKRRTMQIRWLHGKTRSTAKPLKYSPRPMTLEQRLEWQLEMERRHAARLKREEGSGKGTLRKSAPASATAALKKQKGALRKPSKGQPPTIPPWFSQRLGPSSKFAGLRTDAAKHQSS